MAEFQLAISYKTMPMRVMLGAMYTAFPVWSLIAPMSLGFFVPYIFNYSRSMPPFVTAVICLTLLSVFVGGLLFSGFAEDNKIYVSKNGMAFPMYLLSKFGLRRNREWSELLAADITVGASESERVLLLTFSPSLTLALSIANFKKEELEQLLLAIELWAGKCNRTPALIEHQTQLQNENKGLGKVGYTQLWEEELGRKFNATTFTPLEPGATLQKGKLKVVRQMSFGGLSAIYLVQKEGGDVCVLKEAVVPASADPEARKQAEKMLARESEMLFFLYHPNIARVFDHFVEEGRHYLLLEHVNGSDLRQFIKQNGLQKEERVIQFGVQIAEILCFLHGQNPAIVHRDLTPDNLVLKNDGSVVLIDFGAANEFVGTATGTLVGKQAYMAPEQLRGKTVPQSDLYAFGGTLFFLLTGRDPTPLSQANVRSVLPEISEGLNNLILDLTQLERKNRVKTAHSVLQRLQPLAVAD